MKSKNTLATIDCFQLLSEEDKRWVKEMLSLVEGDSEEKDENPATGHNERLMLDFTNAQGAFAT